MAGTSAIFLVVLLVTYMAGLALFLGVACRDGLKDPVSCERIFNWLGEAAFAIVVFVPPFSGFLPISSIPIILIAEIRARRRTRFDH